MKARILATDLASPTPIVAAIQLSDGCELIQTCRADGKNARGGQDDLINIPQKHVRWANVYRGGEEFSIGDTHKSKDEADKSGANQSRIACIRIEFQEGEGL